MAVPSPPTITAPPTPPSRADSANFATRGDAFLGWFPTAWAYLASVVPWMNDRATAMETQANTATDASAAALAAANYKGDWSTLTGALNMPASVRHNGGFWILNSNLANVTTATPGVSSAWIAYSAGAIGERIQALSGTAPSIVNAGGSIKTWTLTGTSAPTVSLNSGEAVTLMITASSFSISWPTTAWKTQSGTAPTLNTSGVTAIVLWNVSGTLYGARVGDA